MDFGAALTYLFRDPQWGKKFLLAGLISFIPVFGHLIVLGWTMRIARSVMERVEQPVSDLELVEDLLRGCKVWGINLFYSLPGLVIAFPLSLGAGFVLTATADQSRLTVFALLLCLTSLLVFYILFLVLLLPAAYGNWLAHGEQFSAGLNVKEVLGLIRRGPVYYFLVFIGGIMCAFFTILGIAGCVIGVVFSGTYALIVMAYLTGKAYIETAGAA